MRTFAYKPYLERLPRVQSMRVGFAVTMVPMVKEDELIGSIQQIAYKYSRSLKGKSH